jgi:hypothetical protein
MILDSEEQRKSLLAIIEVVPVQGPVSQVRETVKTLDKLKAEIMSAAIAEPVQNPEAASGNQKPKGRTTP